MADRECADIVWRKSRRSAQGECVEMAWNGVAVMVRDSKNPGGPVLAFDRRRWDAFLRTLTCPR